MVIKVHIFVLTDSESRRVRLVDAPLFAAAAVKCGDVSSLAVVYAALLNAPHLAYGRREHHLNALLPLSIRCVQNTTEEDQQTGECNGLHVSQFHRSLNYTRLVLKEKSQRKEA